MENDKQLIIRIKSGETPAFRLLVEQYQNRVINTCYSFFNNREDAEDVAQEVFLEVFKSISGFREESKLSTWIYRISVTKSLDVLRKRNRKKRFTKLQQILGFDNYSESLPDKQGLTPEQNAENQERLDDLYKALNTLAENQRTAITLSKLEGYSNQEISEIMETSLSAVESLIHRAKKNLYTFLSHYYKN